MEISHILGKTNENNRVREAHQSRFYNGKTIVVQQIFINTY